VTMPRNPSGSRLIRKRVRPHRLSDKQGDRHRRLALRGQGAAQGPAAAPHGYGAGRVLSLASPFGTSSRWLSDLSCATWPRGPRTATATKCACMYRPLRALHPRGLTLARIAAILATAASWRTEAGRPAPKPDGQVRDILEVLLGTGDPSGAKDLAWNRVIFRSVRRRRSPAPMACGRARRGSGRWPEACRRPRRPTPRSDLRVARLGPGFAVRASPSRRCATGSRWPRSTHPGRSAKRWASTCLPLRWW
jgi:hypothetical protein